MMSIHEHSTSSNCGDESTDATKKFHTQLRKSHLPRSGPPQQTSEHIHKVKCAEAGMERFKGGGGNMAASSCVSHPLGNRQQETTATIQTRGKRLAETREDSEGIH